MSTSFIVFGVKKENGVDTGTCPRLGCSRLANIIRAMPKRILEMPGCYIRVAYKGMFGCRDPWDAGAATLQPSP